MYRNESFRRVYARIHYLRKKQRSSQDNLARLELTNRIQNLKSLLVS